MLAENLLKYGILRTRDLVELYYGARMVGVSLTPTYFNNFSGQPTQIFKQDPRRYKYRIVFGANGGATTATSFARTADIVAAQSVTYQCGSGQIFVLERNFLSDLESVCEELWCLNANAGLFLSTQEWILVPAPVDEVPLG